MTGQEFDRVRQDWFAALSGDFNPMHVDPHHARRLQTGGAVVHGVHAALWALDTALRDGAIDRPIAAIACRFAKFIRVGSDVALRIQRSDESGALLHLETDGLVTTTINVRFGERANFIDPDAKPGEALPTTPEERDVAEMSELAGSFNPFRPLPDYAAAFPALAANIGAERIAGLTILSSIVGMVCPGTHSIFDSFDVKLVEQAGPYAMGYRVETADPRFRQVRMKVGGCGLNGAMTTFVRHPLPVLPSVAALAGQIEPGAFAGTRTLVIGGSRGLGALTAKLIALGGGAVVATYASGHDDATALAAEINDFAGRELCAIARFDVLTDSPVELAAALGPVTHLYYFATTQIFRQKRGMYAPGLLAEFLRVYVDGFHEACLAAMGAGGLTAFFPSTTFLDKRQNQFTEYCMAKAAGEVLCADLDRYVPNLRVVCKRLPRMLTDQTATVALAKSDDPVTVMAPIIREVQGLVGKTRN